MTLRSSKTEHLSLLVSVVGLSGCGPHVYKGPGKSSLCFNLLHPTEYLKEHPSTLTVDQFESKVIDRQHYVYWGSKTEYYYKLPKSKKVTDNKVMVTVTFEIFEQTEFIEDVTQKPFPAKQEYADRALKLPHSSNKLSFKSVPLILSPEKYNATISSNTRGVKCGYIFAIDVSEGCPTFHHQLTLLKRMVKSHKKQFVIAATKYDQVNKAFYDEVKVVGESLGVEVIPTSIEKEDGQWVTEVFKYIAIKIFNLQREGAEGVVGDSYLRYATEPPSRTPTKSSEPKSEISEVPPPIPPRNYAAAELPQSPQPVGDHHYGNFTGKSLDVTQSPSTSKSNPDLTETELRVTEIPKRMIEQRARTLNNREAIPHLQAKEPSPRPKPIKSLSESSDAPPPLPPKPVPRTKGGPKSPQQAPAVSVPTKLAETTAMAARPLPKLPFVSEDETDHYSMRCDYDKIDYTKMYELRKIQKSATKPLKRIKSKPFTLPVVPTRDILRSQKKPISEITSWDQEAKPRNKEALSRDQEALPQNQEAKPRNQGALSRDKEALPQNQGAVPRNQGALSRDKEALPQNQEVMPTSNLKRKPPPIAKKPTRRRSDSATSPPYIKLEPKKSLDDTTNPPYISLTPKKDGSYSQSLDYKDTISKKDVQSTSQDPVDDTTNSPHVSFASKEHVNYSQSLEYEDTISKKDVQNTFQDSEYDDTGYVNDGENKKKVASTGSPSQPKYPPRCIPRKYYFLTGRRAIPTT